jgi:hypothetical protein
MKVQVEIEEIELEGDYAPVPSVCARCSRCGHETESYGTGTGSVKRCLVLLREECPEDENNFYVADEAEDD